MTPSRYNRSIAKIARPRVAGVFPRTRLFNLLDRYLNSSAVWISASAGSGKTTLAASYIKERDIPSIWYQMDEGDADIATFFYYLGCAASKEAPRRRPLPLLTPEYLQGIGTFTARYFENLFSRLKPPFMIVFDNYQLVPHNSQLHQIICTGLESIPDGINMICISREDPPSVFARPRANGLLGLIDPREIRFTLEEARTMVHVKGLEELSEKAIHALHERTEGWAAGLVLMMEQARLSVNEAAIRSNLTLREVFDYFSHELFERSDHEMREFLLKTAFLPKMTAKMAKTLTGISHAGRILNSLYQRNFFIQSDVQQQPFYQYHPLFRGFLMSRVEDLMTTEQALAIRQDSARVLEETGQIEAAAELFMGAGDWPRLTSLVLSHAPAIVGQGRGDTLQNWLEAFPERFLDKVPWLLYWKGICSMLFNPGEGFMFLEKAHRLFRERGDDAGALISWAGLIDACFYEFDDQRPLDGLIDWLDEKTSQEYSFPTLEIELAVAAAMVSALVLKRPTHPEVRNWIGRALSLSQNSSNAILSVSAPLNAAFFYSWMGETAGLRIVLDWTRGMARQKSASPLINIASRFIETHLHMQHPDEFDRALRAASEALEIGEETGVHILDMILLAQLAYGELITGRFRAARGYLEKMEGIRESGSRVTYAIYCHVQSFCCLNERDIPAAATYGEEGASITRMMAMPFPDAMSRLISAQVLFEVGDYKRAAEELAVAEDFFIRIGSSYFCYTCNLIKAWFACSLGKKDDSIQEIRDAFSLARAKGYTHAPYFWRPDAMVRLCIIALEAGVEVDYVQMIIQGLNLSPAVPPVEVTNWPWPVKIYTLGNFELYRNGNPVRSQGKAQKKIMQLLMAIISLGGRNIRNERLKDLLWPDAEGDKAQSAFTSAMSRLRDLLGNDSAVPVHDGKVSLDPFYCWVDAWAFERLAALAEVHERKENFIDEAYSHAEKAIRIYKGAFLDGEYDKAWVIPLREQLLKRYCRLVSAVGTELEKAGKPEKAVEYYNNALDTDEISDEDLYQRLMIYYFEKDQPERAMKVYLRLTRILSSTLGIRPSRKTQAIHKRLTR